MGSGGFVSGIITSKSERGVVFARTDVGGAYRWDGQAGRWVARLPEIFKIEWYKKLRHTGFPFWLL